MNRLNARRGKVVAYATPRGSLLKEGYDDMIRKAVATKRSAKTNAAKKTNAASALKSTRKSIAKSSALAKRSVGRPKGSKNKPRVWDDEPVVVKRPVGRPKGSKNKPRVWDDEPVVAKRPVGRPKGSVNKPRVGVEPSIGAKRPVGRPKGSVNKPRVETEAPIVAKRPVGRPKGSVNKPRVETEAPIVVKRPVGRPKGSVNKPRVETEAPIVVKRPVGRPKGCGKYGEPSKSFRAPASLSDKIEGFVARNGDVVKLYNTLVQAGFPSPAEDASYEMLDLGRFLMPNPPATFFIRAIGESMRDAGVFPGDILVVDRSLEPMNGDVVVAALDGEFTVKRLFKTKNRIELRPENKRFPVIPITEECEFSIWGVVKKVIHNV